MDRYTEIVEKALEKALPESDGDYDVVNSAMRYSLLSGGKRIRPVLTLAFCKLCGEDPLKALPFACAVEMVHTYSLIHDDLPCMDNDDLRRGKPANHKVYGEAMALLAGDGLLTHAFETLLSYDVDASIALKAARLLAKCAGAGGMVGGQCIDLCLEGHKAELKNLKAMDEGKTVALIAAACGMGCIAGGASGGQLEMAREYAEGVGMAFQLRDDILDVLGHAETLGKNTGMDSARDKSNYVSLLGVDEAQKLADSYTKEAVDALRGFSGDTSFLTELAYFLTRRES